jgi:hypothetical protein
MKKKGSCGICRETPVLSYYLYMLSRTAAKYTIVHMEREDYLLYLPQNSFKPISSPHSRMSGLGVAPPVKAMQPTALRLRAHLNVALLRCKGGIRTFPTEKVSREINPALVTSDLYSEIPTWHIGTNAKFKDAAIVPKSFKRNILPVSDCSP